MGFDIHGLQPKSSKGQYFRNNCWWWRTLWSYVSQKGIEQGILTEEDAISGQYNDFHKIDKEKSLKLATHLRYLVSSGLAKKFEKSYAAYLDELPDVECGICKGEGERNDAYVKGICNVCNGKGKRRPDDCSYPFSVENVQDFIDFIEESGGFEIG